VSNCENFFSNVKAYINDSEEAGVGNNYGDLEKKLRVRLDECMISVASFLAFLTRLLLHTCTLCTDGRSECVREGKAEELRTRA